MKKLIFIFIIVLLFAWNFKLPNDIFDYNYSRLVLDRNNNILRVTLNNSEQFILPPGKTEIPMKLKKAVIYFEDKNFYKHHGVDLIAIIRAINENIRYGLRSSGASTITMQVSRIFKPKDRNIYNKIKEVFHAFQIETKFDKDQILNLYLNHAPYGGNIRGYQTASYKYFNKDAEFLTWAEAATLAILPNAPSSLTTVKNRDRFLKKRNLVLEKMYLENIISESDYKLSLMEALPDKIYPFPFKAPHFTERVLRNSKETVINTTLNLNTQNDIEDLLSSLQRDLKRKGINNSAILIADNKTKEIITYIGSQDYFDSKHSGQIDGISAFRSTGSVLKPFLYALAMDDGLIIPDSLLEDVPINYGSFSPLNSSRNYSGVVSARDALRKSLNVPAVNLLNLYGSENFYNFLKSANISNLNSDWKHYGLTSILGSIETSLWDLCRLYSSLGDYGKISDFKYFNNQKSTDKKNLFSSGSAYLTLDILKDVSKPNYFKNNNIEFYWKTGTSFGQRDALAIGVNSDYIIGVWTGNFNGQASSYLSGIESSAPILFHTLSMLYSTKTYEQNKINGKILAQENSLKSIKVTENYYSAILKEKELSEFENINLNKSFISSKAKKLRKDPYQKLLYKDKENKLYEHPIRNQELSKTLQTVFSSEIRHFLDKQGIKTISITENMNENIKFIYPQNGMKIKLPKDINGEFEKVKIEILSSNNSNSSSEYFWFINKKFVQKSKKQKIFLSLEKGYNKLTVLDNKGTSETISVYIE